MFIRCWGIFWRWFVLIKMFEVFLGLVVGIVWNVVLFFVLLN